MRCSNLMSAWIILLLINVSTRCSGKCFTFMGFNSCMTQFQNADEDFPFTPEWFFVNVFKRIQMIKFVKRHFFDVRLVEMTVNMYAPLKEAKEFTDLDEFWKAIAQIVEYIGSVQGDPVELLYDERVNPIDLLRSFRGHAEEITGFIRSADEGGAFSEDVQAELERLCRLLQDTGKILHRLPEFTDTSYFKMIEQSAYRDPQFAALASLGDSMLPGSSE
ncbi:uncharacterized protein LOC100904325 [Galendromus occidentalis]|uniref:Uncharacterized protein LOC100904325 n=1 Tax=Galendromus occidentalis TaxID=34638 RepID=A0AAJ7L691_9ACAR|nr:uncharacterized protein LOC100904325 [Galendromus occidentalis]